jgi:hypothetical protein
MYPSKSKGSRGAAAVVGVLTEVAPALDPARGATEQAKFKNRRAAASAGAKAGFVSGLVCDIGT